MPGDITSSNDPPGKPPALAPPGKSLYLSNTLGIADAGVVNPCCDVKSVSS